jgi:two-component system nitrogen regulation response regulator GlnG
VFANSHECERSGDANELEIDRMAQLAIRETLVGESAAMRRALEAAEEAAACDIPILIEGEAGSGRELMARSIHYASARREGEFVTFKAHAATPSEVIDGELVGGGGKSAGHLRRAIGGTLLLKDIVEVPRGPQKKLARMVPRVRRAGRDETPIGETLDVRFIASTDLDPLTAVETGLLDRELAERLGARRIEVPPLRRRIEDLPRLAATFLRQFSQELKRGKVDLASRAVDRLMRYPWPGNVAELKDVVRRVLLRTRGSVIDGTDLDGILPELEDRVPLENMPFEEMVRSKLRGFLARNQRQIAELCRNRQSPALHKDVMQRVERPLIELVLEHTGGNQVLAAQILDLNRNTLRKKIVELGITPKRG